MQEDAGEVRAEQHECLCFTFQFKDDIDYLLLYILPHFTTFIKYKLIKFLIYVRITS